MIERKSKRIFLIGYVSLMIIMVIMSSCGSVKEFHIGTGQELGKSRCTGNYIGG